MLQRVACAGGGQVAKQCVRAVIAYGESVDVQYRITQARLEHQIADIMHIDAAAIPVRGR